jgi:hypothetical protein
MALFGTEIALAELDFGDTSDQADCFLTLTTLFTSCLSHRHLSVVHHCLVYTLEYVTNLN